MSDWDVDSSSYIAKQIFETMLVAAKEDKKEAVKMDKVKRRPKNDIYNCGYCDGNGFTIKYVVDYDKQWGSLSYDESSLGKAMKQEKVYCLHCKGSGLLNRILSSMYRKQMTIFNTVDFPEKPVKVMSSGTKNAMASYGMYRSDHKSTQISFDEYAKRLENNIKDIIE